MHYLLGLAALVMGAVIATRRTRPTWFVVTTCVLVGVGALLAILSYTRVTDPLGFLANSILGWVFVGFAIITMMASIFVLERRGPRGEEWAPLIGDNPFDGDTDDSDDPEPGVPVEASGGSAAASRGQEGPPAETDPGYDAWVAAGEPSAPDGAAAEGGAADDGTERTDRA